MDKSQSKGRLLALITGVFSIVIGVIYLVLITVLDSRGPMRPPPLEALGQVGVAFGHSFEEVQRLCERLIA